MNANDLPPAARLAALIEAGMTAHPGITFDGRAYWNGPNNCGCAMMFAARGAGVAVHGAMDVMMFMDECGLWAGRLPGLVEMAAFETTALEDVIKSLREGELALVAA